MKKRLIASVAGVVAVSASLAAYYRANGPADAPGYAMSAAARGSVVDTVEATGTLQAVTTVQVGSQVSGTIQSLYADFNSQVRKGDLAVGARDVDVLTQFLVEAIVLSLAGGAIGILMELGVSYGVSQFLQWPTAVTAESVAMSSGVAAVTGMFFGLYPARKAAALHPIDALRYE